MDELKVDRSFVIRMADSPEAAAIVRATVGLAHELGLRVVAEGVETAEQRAALVALGCTAAQGYHFFKPMPADKIGAVLGSLRDSARVERLPAARRRRLLTGPQPRPRPSPGRARPARSARPPGPPGPRPARRGLSACPVRSGPVRPAGPLARSS